MIRSEPRVRGPRAALSLDGQIGDRLILVEQHLADAKATIERLEDNIAKLLAAVAKHSGPCPHCRKVVWFVYSLKTNKTVMYEAEGQPHWGLPGCHATPARERTQ